MTAAPAARARARRRRILGTIRRAAPSTARPSGNSKSLNMSSTRSAASVFGRPKSRASLRGMPASMRSAGGLPPPHERAVVRRHSAILHERKPDRASERIDGLEVADAARRRALPEPAIESLVARAREAAVVIEGPIYREHPVLRQQARKRGEECAHLLPAHDVQ